MTRLSNLAEEHLERGGIEKREDQTFDVGPVRRLQQFQKQALAVRSCLCRPMPAGDLPAPGTNERVRKIKQAELVGVEQNFAAEQPGLTWAMDVGGCE